MRLHFRFIFAAVMAALLFSFDAYCQASSESPQPASQVIKHTPLEADKLPFPGKPIKLWIALNKTRSIDLRIRAFVVIDGKVMDVPLTHPTYNEADDLVFSGEVPAPLERISYQFFIHGSNPGDVQASPRYSIQRKCVPILTPELVNNEPASPNKDEGITPLLMQNEGLERDIDLLNSSVATLNKIKSLLK